MDYVQIQKELCRAIRGKFSQEQISRRMGFRSNPIYRWESGLSSVDWKSFLDLCRACKRDLPLAIEYVLGFTGEVDSNADWFMHLLGTTKASEISRKTGISRFTAGKWVSGKSSMDLAFVLRLLNEFQFILIEFVEALVPMDQVPSLQPIAERLNKQKDAIYQNPEIEAVLCCFTLEEYKLLKTHQRGFIAKKIGLTLAQEDKCVDLLKSTGLIFEKEKKYHAPTTQLDTQGSFAGSVRIRQYWGQLHMDELARAKPPEGKKSKSGYFLIDLSAKGEEQVFKAYIDFCFKLRAIAQQDHGAKKTVKYCSALLIDLPESAEISKSR